MDGLSRKTVCTFMFGAICAAALSAAAYTSFASQPKRWGPISCSECTQLQIPYLDQAAKDTLKKFEDDPYPNTIDFFSPQVEIGDVITICTPSVCVDYKLNSSRNYEGVQTRPVESVGGGGVGDSPGGGGGSGGGGGGAPIGGCYGKCNGEITVGA